MNTRAACLLASVVMFSGCEEKKEITVTETRAATTRDVAPKLFATSDERFRDAIADYLDREREAVGEEVEVLTALGPFRREAREEQD